MSLLHLPRTSSGLQSCPPAALRHPRRDILTERRIEAARSEMGAAAAQASCLVCMQAPRDTFLNCGHLICRRAVQADGARRLHKTERSRVEQLPTPPTCRRACSERVAACPVCRQPITSRTRAFV